MFIQYFKFSKFFNKCTVKKNDIINDLKAREAAEPFLFCA